ncbi:hypothetical protein [Saccharicrinis aurantiacus]|uniref:hypothetical protein n=1 Tax=Saccharicrinis aurantiacus TaxID=1849719 RepID=UPI000838AE3D|nr:hypothetical protein [Saccharicrinis aurantiacus]
MKKLIIAVLCILPLGLFAQINATTEDGKKVLLYENGTWILADTTSFSETVQAGAGGVYELDANVNKESNMGELLYEVSPRLEKYFGPIKGKVKASSKVIAQNGKVKVFFQFEYTLPDANRYYGRVQSGTIIKLYNKKDEEIELSLTDDIKFEVLEKYNFSFYTVSAWLTPEQAQDLFETPVEYLEVHWKKGAEKYKVGNEFLIMNGLKELKK